MKPFSFYPIKVALTSITMLGIGYQTSLQIKQWQHTFPKTEQTDMASTDSATIEVKDNKNQTGTVRYLPEGKEKTIALVPKKDTQGAFCNCGYDTVLLDVSFDKGNIAALNNALLSKMISGTAKLSGTADKPLTEKMDKTDPNKLNWARLESMRKACEPNDAESLVSYNECVVKGFEELLADKNVSKEVALKFYSEKMESYIVRQLSDRQIRPEDSRKSAVELSLYDLDLLIKVLPPQYNSVRERIMFTQSQAIRKAAGEYRQLLEMAQREPDAFRRSQLSLQATEQQTFMKNLDLAFDGLSHPEYPSSSMSIAVLNKDISLQDARRVYQENYVNIGKNLIQNSNNWHKIGIFNGRSQDIYNLNVYRLPDTLLYPNLFKVEGVNQRTQVINGDLPGRTANDGSQIPDGGRISGSGSVSGGISGVRSFDLNSKINTIPFRETVGTVGSVSTSSSTGSTEGTTTSGIQFGRQEKVSAATRAEANKIRQNSAAYWRSIGNSVTK